MRSSKITSKQFVERINKKSSENFRAKEKFEGLSDYGSIVDCENVSKTNKYKFKDTALCADLEKGSDIVLKILLNNCEDLYESGKNLCNYKYDGKVLDCCEKKLSGGAIAGIVIAVLVFVVILILCFLKFRKKDDFNPVVKFQFPKISY